MWLDFHLIRWYKISLGLLGLFYCLQPGAMVFVQDYWTVLFICMVVIQEVDGNSDILDSTATIELVLHSKDNVRSSKYVRGVYTSAGAVRSVEGDLEQVNYIFLINNILIILK